MSELSGTDSPWVLVTNDDGMESPALMPLLTELASVAPVRALVPAEERSWSSKTMSRFESLAVTEVQVGGDLTVMTLNGSPADCANLGIFSLWPTRPSLVVSGINMGANAGLSFLLSSGTVGAAMEGVLSGIPAVASSVKLRDADYRRWTERAELDDLNGLWQSAAIVSSEIAAEVLSGGLPDGASMLSVNMPPDTTPETPRRFAGVTPTTYGAFYARTEGGCYQHELAGLQVLEDDDGDMAAIERGEVAITPLQFTFEVAVRAEDRRRFERSASRNTSPPDETSARA